jgi:lysophospholipase L1-like esterase
MAYNSFMARLKIKLARFHKISPLRKIMNILGLFFLFLVLLELVLRGIGFFVSWQTLHYNTPQKSSPSAYTILCLGDSWTAGRPDGNYPEYLGRELAKSYPHRQFHIENLGSSGTNSSQCLKKFLEVNPLVKPQMVIVMTGNNDHWNLSASSYWMFQDRRLGQADVLKAKARIFLHSLRVYKLYKTIYFKLTGRPTPNQFFYRPAKGETGAASISVIDRATHKKQLQFNLLKFVELSRMNDFKLIFQTYFHFHGYEVNEVIRDVALSYHIPLIDNNLLFHQRIAVKDREKYLIPDGHPSPLGYQFIAKNIMDIIKF